MIPARFGPEFTPLLWIVALGPLPACATVQDVTQNGEYTSPNYIFSVLIPSPTNFAGIPYSTTVLDTKGDPHYDKVMFHVDDFGNYFVVSARLMPADSVPLMDKDSHRTVLRNLSEASLMGWRIDFDQVPEVAEESFIESEISEALVRVYRAKKGSILTMAQGRVPTRADAFDTNIVSIVARKGAVVGYVLGQDDSRPDDSSAITKMLVEVFQSIKILSGP